jgi:hypothetical protein
MAKVTKLEDLNREQKDKILDLYLREKMLIKDICNKMQIPVWIIGAYLRSQGVDTKANIRAIVNDGVPMIDEVAQAVARFRRMKGLPPAEYSRE